MKIESLTLQGFKCFKEKTTVSLNSLTCFVGSNGTGKTAVMEALCRLFGESENIRRVRREDFYVEQGCDFESQIERSFFIEAKIIFPELNQDDLSETSIPLFFEHMTITTCGAAPYCRIRLIANWQKGNTAEGNLDFRLYWVLSPNEDPKENEMQPFSQRDKNRIRVFYIPAIRNPELQLKSIAGTVIKRLFDAVKWSNDTKDDVEHFSEKLNENFQKEKGIKHIHEILNKFWVKYMSGSKYSSLQLRPAEKEFSFLINNINAFFSPGNTSGVESVDHLSDGMRSLFYLTLLNTLHSIENTIKDDDENFDCEKINKPDLTIFALEEPENHLAPHYIGRVISVFRGLTNENTQVVISSHSSSILKRIEPEEIRFFRLEQDLASVKAITLPSNKAEEFKYVKEAVKAYPELYFSKMVVLGEGDSESYVVPKLSKINGLDLDNSFVSFVPLGGRFVNHYWRLLEDLKIPYVTLLDFDEGRGTGGDERKKYILKQLRLINKIDEDDYSSLMLLKNDIFVKRMETYNVFFSYPLDLDFLMLSNYFDEYTKVSESSPNIPKQNDPKKIDEDKWAVAAVLKKKTIDNITIPSNVDTYYWYRTLFLEKAGKPVSHYNGLNEIEANGNKIIVLENFLETVKKGVVNA